jgi:hypothetical protein
VPPGITSNQFVEIKSTVFRKFEKENLFQLTCADVVERFQVRGGVDSGVLLVIVEDWPGKLDPSPRLPTKLNAPVFPGPVLHNHQQHATIHASTHCIIHPTSSIHPLPIINM